MKLKSMWWYFFNKQKYRNYQILCWIKSAKDYYVNKGCTGMCFAFIVTIPKIFEKTFSLYSIEDGIRVIIPNYYPEYFGSDRHNGQYWWNIDEHKPRIEAFDKLISDYVYYINCKPNTTNS